MTVTNDERREISARLRYVAEHGAPEWETSADCIAICLKELDSPLWSGTEKLFALLADFIEPEPERTCQNITRHPHYGFECSECGWDAYEPNDYGNDVCFDEFSYCPKCGCKVEQ